MTLSRQVGVFVVRVWREPTDVAESPWRASVLDTVTKERYYFADPEDLAAFLRPLGLGETPLGLDDLP